MTRRNKSLYLACCSSCYTVHKTKIIAVLGESVLSILLGSSPWTAKDVKSQLFLERLRGSDFRCQTVLDQKMRTRGVKSLPL